MLTKQEHDHEKQLVQSMLDAMLRIVEEHDWSPGGNQFLVAARNQGPPLRLSYLKGPKDRAFLQADWGTSLVQIQFDVSTGEVADSVRYDDQGVMTKNGHLQWTYSGFSRDIEMLTSKFLRMLEEVRSTLHFVEE